MWEYSLRASLLRNFKQVAQWWAEYLGSLGNLENKAKLRRHSHRLDTVGRSWETCIWITFPKDALGKYIKSLFFLQFAPLWFLREDLWFKNYVYAHVIMCGYGHMWEGAKEDRGPEDPRSGVTGHPVWMLESDSSAQESMAPNC